jgi:hypothetical protein
MVYIQQEVAESAYFLRMDLRALRIDFLAGFLAAAFLAAFIRRMAMLMCSLNIKNTQHINMAMLAAMTVSLAALVE